MRLLLISSTATMADSDNESDFASAESDHEVVHISLKLFSLFQSLCSCTTIEFHVGQRKQT